MKLAIYFKHLMFVHPVGLTPIALFLVYTYYIGGTPITLFSVHTYYISATPNYTDLGSILHFITHI